MKYLNWSLLFFLGMMVFNPWALAHEKREVLGKYAFVVGLVNEPAFSGQMNGLDLRVSQGDQPVLELDKTLKASVSWKGKKRSLPLTLRTRYQQPGAYAGYFLPVKPGQYVFHITGNINGEVIDETFTSGHGFHDVEDSKPLRFP